MYLLRYFRRSDRRLLSGEQRRESLPVQPEIGTRLVEARPAEGIGNVQHWDGNE
jgi:hypothetical protein